MPSSSKSKGKHGKRHKKSSHGGHHSSFIAQDEPGESSQQARHEDTGAGREFGRTWRAIHEPGSDESSVDRGRHRRQQHEYESYTVPSLSPPRRRHKKSKWGAQEQLQSARTHDLQAQARNSWRRGREAARARDSGTKCVIL